MELSWQELASARLPALASRNAFTWRSLIGRIASRSSSRPRGIGDSRSLYEAIIRSGARLPIAKTLKGLKTTNSGRDTRGRAGLEPLFMNLVRRKRLPGADLWPGNGQRARDTRSQGEALYGFQIDPQTG